VNQQTEKKVHLLRS